MKNEIIQNDSNAQNRSAFVHRVPGREGRGILKLDFDRDGECESVSDADISRLFEENELHFLYQEEGRNGGWSRVFSFVRRTQSA